MIDQVLGAYTIHGGSASSRHFFSQRLGTRFVRARLAAEAAGSALLPSEFIAAFRWTYRQRYGDLVSYLYRRAGLAVADRRPLRAAFYGTLACLLGPHYVIPRLHRQHRRPDE